MFGTIGVPELLLILLIVIIFFGAGKLPQLGKGLGEGIKNFRTSLKGEHDDKEGSAKGSDGAKNG